ncbi:MAG TPA: histidine kinase [Streptosporangiaceae bacterium]|nr:histidine kinase [Streptosporangiaceae bacterium]
MLDSRVRRRAADVAYVGAGAVLGVLFLLGSMADEPASSRPSLPLDLTVGGLACLALLLRRRLPVAVAVTLALAGMFASSMAFGVTFIAIYNVAVRRSWRVTAAVAALQYSLVAGLSLLDSPSTRTYVETILVVGLLDAVLITSGMLVRAQRRLVQSLRERARQAEEEQRLRVEEARHLERERIAREMHDVLAHRISLLAMHAGALEIRKDAPPAQARAAGVIRQCAHEAMEDLREVIGMLRADGGDERRPQPTLTDLPALIEESRRAAGPVSFDNQIGDLATVPVRIGRHAYRIVQEALTNARKHAPRAGVRVIIDGAPGAELTIDVRNTLSPAATARHPAATAGRLPATAAGHFTSDAAGRLPGAGAGLIGLRERVGLVGGRLEHGRTGGGEFRLQARLPWPT